MWRLWFQVVVVMPFLGPGLLCKDEQRFARYLLLNDASNRDAGSEEDIELFGLRPLPRLHHGRGPANHARDGPGAPADRPHPASHRG
jgi:hypothetical protein